MKKCKRTRAAHVFLTPMVANVVPGAGCAAQQRASVTHRRQDGRAGRDADNGLPWLVTSVEKILNYFLEPCQRDVTDTSPNRTVNDGPKCPEVSA